MRTRQATSSHAIISARYVERRIGHEVRRTQVVRPIVVDVPLELHQRTSRVLVERLRVIEFNPEILAGRVRPQDRDRDRARLRQRPGQNLRSPSV